MVRVHHGSFRSLAFAGLSCTFGPRFDGSSPSRLTKTPAHRGFASGKNWADLVSVADFRRGCARNVYGRSTAGSFAARRRVWSGPCWPLEAFKRCTMARSPWYRMRDSHGRTGIGPRVAGKRCDESVDPPLDERNRDAQSPFLPLRDRRSRTKKQAHDGAPLPWLGR